MSPYGQSRGDSGIEFFDVRTNRIMGIRKGEIFPVSPVLALEDVSGAGTLIVARERAAARIGPSDQMLHRPCDGSVTLRIYSPETSARLASMAERIII